LAHDLASEVGLHDHAHALDLYVAHPRRPLERILRVVDDDPHRQAVDDGRRAPRRRSNPAPEPTGSGGPEQHNSPCARPGANKVSPRPSPIPFHGPTSSLTKCAALADGTRLLPKCRQGPAAQEALGGPEPIGSTPESCGGLRRAARPGRCDCAGYWLQNRTRPRVAEILSPSDRPGEVLEKVGSTSIRRAGAGGLEPPTSKVARPRRSPSHQAR